ncbi:MAG TPA: cytochrome C oxidase subunit III [Deltaproteobacteria bacterium]|nr:MAG: cytochrome C oxidase subunit III [Deltaproteobacteria bacterium GWA2_55_82]OGQ62262.1 MAG: cytochrome C oxidase subunit III [Deltaproteobacteria bacterium RIFCSPLOWO2_02_FULL_55_12]OIJ74373.1 MAG: cytochrome C oxidase subunit III [Deltaproteobacteria bacterium GWC2_55_46]HBG47021.1 cytochrome C oxidase subunit III [Deltaproteobacteria bacterium]HCY10919.1 cytochrome C oxidase subunit III [Deltaproteobacteria bacterium]
MKGAEVRHRDYTGAKIGMWLFLFTEFFLFFAPVLLYTVFRLKHAAAFADASLKLDLRLGAVNTAILLTSSLTMALSVSAMQKGKYYITLAMLGATFSLGVAFLVNKYFEWVAKIYHGIYPGSEALAQGPPGEPLFYGLYYFLTGLHGIHVAAGLCGVGFAAALVLRGRITGKDYVKLENTGLYWHLVDVIWIYLFPIFYLVR